jgi:MOSC domain-containing protein YiiM
VTPALSLITILQTRSFADENYALVESRLGVALPRPTFGENLTATGISHEQVYIGDHFKVGEAVICVAQPTERCRTVGRCAGMPKILKELHELEVCGFYARVVKPGWVAAGDRLLLCDRPQPSWSIKRLHRLMFHGLADSRSRRRWRSSTSPLNGKGVPRPCAAASDAVSP